MFVLILSKSGSICGLHKPTNLKTKSKKKICYATNLDAFWVGGVDCVKSIKEGRGQCIYYRLLNLTPDVFSGIVSSSTPPGLIYYMYTMFACGRGVDRLCWRL